VNYKSPDLQSLKHLNTFGVDVKSGNIDFVSTEKMLVSILRKNLSKDFKVIGGGSNILFTSDPQEHLIINRIKGIKIVEENLDYVYVESGGGEVWHDLVLWAIDKGYGGIENLSLIPGTVGAAPIQNIGAYGVEQENVFHNLSAIELSTGKKIVFDKDECCFGYRDSIFKNELKGKYLITKVVYKLRKNPVLELSYGAIQQEVDKRRILNPTIKEVSDVVIDIRKAKLPDPKVLGNCGSFFKNPIISKGLYDQLRLKFLNMPYYPYSEGMVKIPAGWLIDKGGWKGLRKGNVGTHENQALVIVNYGTATGNEIWNFAQDLVEKVFHKYGIRLEPEVNVW
jgi:UDP-N-acetylmuramate dehydrogenase